MIKRLSKFFLEDLAVFFKKLDEAKNQFLYVFIRRFWPRIISPNHLSWSRVLISTILTLLMFFFNVNDKFIIVALFSIGAITDLLDGAVARCLHQTTEFGAVLDSTADRMLIIPIAVYSLWDSNIWLLFALGIGELANFIVSLYYRSKEIYLESNIFGKVKMVLLCFVFLAVMVMWPNSPSLFFINMLWFSLIFTFLNIFTRILELKNPTSIYGNH